MPEMGGAHMVDEIRAIKPETKFIVITGDTGQLALEDSAKNGFKFDHFIAKPVVFQALFTAIDQCLGD
jgi:CheY-like chemotaxis protein